MDGLTIVSGLITCILSYTIFKIVLRLGQRRHRQFYKHASKFPGPPTLPFIGNAHLLSGSTEDIFDRFAQLSKLYPAPYRLWIGNHLAIFINTPEQLRTVLLSSKTFDRGPFFDFGRPWLGTGLLMAPAAKWRVHRKIIQPTFSSTILKSFVDIFSARSVTTVKEMERNLNGPEFDILNYTSQYAVHTVCETTMGVNIEAQNNGKGCYAETLKKQVTVLCKRMVSPWLHPDIIFERTQLGRDQKKYINFMHAFTNDVIQTKKKEFLERSHRADLSEIKEDTGDDIPRRKILLDHLIEMSHSSDSLSNEELREEVDTIIAAGTDTTAVMSSYVMLMLASNPEIQEKACQELWKIYGDDESVELNFTPETLTRMAYMECVIKETMRLLPIAPILMRSVAEDLNVGEHTFPEGSLLFLSIIDLHRNDVHWPNPMKFDPDRFLPKEVENRGAYTYLPFSGGPKNCIGSKYAMMSMKILLATVLRKYILKKDDIIPVEDLRFRWEFVLRPVNPITLRIESRKRRVAPA